MKKLLLLLALTITSLSNSQIKEMEGVWELQNREGLLSYTVIILNDNKSEVGLLNSSTKDLSKSTTEKIISQNKKEIITNYGFFELGYNLTTKAFLHKNLLHRVILNNNDTLKYKFINKISNK